jgi:hypothetical protein
MDTMGEFEDLEDIDGLDIVGAERAIQLRKAMRLRGRAEAARPVPDWMRGLSGQGISRPAEELDPLPFDVIQFPSGVLAAGATSSATAFPQRPFRGERLVASAIKTNAGVSTDVSNGIIISPAIFVGAVQVGSSQGDMSLSVFSNQAFGVRLAFPPTGQGSRIFIPFRLGFAQVAGDSVVINFTVIGRAVR